MDYSAAYHGERTYFDSVVKERISRLIDSRARGIACDFGMPYHAADASLFDVGFRSLSSECSTYRNFVADITYEDIADYETDFHAPVRLQALTSLGMADIVDARGTIRKCSDSEILERVSRYAEEITDNEELLLVEFVRALELYTSGEKAKALSSDIFRDVCSGLSFIFSPKDCILPPEFGADNAALLINCFNTGSESSTRVIVSVSEEAFLYESYRSLLPPDIRDVADGYVGVFKAPVSSSSDSWLRGGRYGKYLVSLVVSVEEYGMLDGVDDDYYELACEASACTHDFSVYYETAIRWMDKNLPALRERYCVGNDGCAA